MVRQELTSKEGNLDMKQHRHPTMAGAFDIAWSVLKYEPVRSMSRAEADRLAGADYGQGRRALNEEARRKADDFHTARREAMRPRPISTVADPSQYRFLGHGNTVVDVGGPATNPFPGGTSTIQEDMDEIERDERVQHLIDNFTPQPAEMSRSAPTGPNPVQPPKSDMSPQGSFPTSMGPTRQQKRGEMGRGVAVKRPGFRSSEAMPLPESARDRERELTFSRRL